jgi:hypothetical protein
MAAAVVGGALSSMPHGAAEDFAVYGRCGDELDGAAVEGAILRLFASEHRMSSPVEVARTTPGADGAYEFTNIEPPAPYNTRRNLSYLIVADAPNRPMAVADALVSDPRRSDPRSLRVHVRFGRDVTAVGGRVIDAEGRPVSGAHVTLLSSYGQALPDSLSTMTDADGRFSIANVHDQRRPELPQRDQRVLVQHPDFPSTIASNFDPMKFVIQLPIGCVVEGRVEDQANEQPVVDALIAFHWSGDPPERLEIEGLSRSHAATPVEAVTDEDGRFRTVIRPGDYNLSMQADDHVCPALKDQSFDAGATVAMPPFRATPGGFIYGRVVDHTGKPVAAMPEGYPVWIALVGPGHLGGAPLAATDDQGRFVLRAAAGENYPYFFHDRGDRMAHNVDERTPVVVREGGTTTVKMTLEPPPQLRNPFGRQRQQAAELVLAALPEEPQPRVDAILKQLQAMNQNVDDADLWCALMRELVRIGPAAVPRLCEELDGTDSNLAMRRLAFVLRAIGDGRAVPALIRAIPKTLQPPGSDFGLIVADPELMAFMQEHDLDERDRDQHFSFGRPVREVFGALHKLTGEEFADAELFGMTRRNDARRTALQRRIYQRQAERWAQWWNDHAREFVDDLAYYDVKLPPFDDPVPAPVALADVAKLESGFSGLVVSPPAEPGEHVWHFIDLDTGRRPNWPKHIPRDEATLDFAELEKWAREVGADLMCVSYTDPDGAEVFALRGLDLKAVELTEREVGDLEENLAAREPPKGRPTGDLLIHADPETRESTANVNAAFLYTTREGTHGLIETTDRVVRTADLTGMPAGGAPAGVGFRRGVKLDWKPLTGR